ncbi:hypothetical protein ACFWNK_38065 [Streptomyces sp. NPDC058417]|uniref:hypothetical protein n=1 Tax=unclassified Streptomyces TaxID=2593676 RepID=UPI0036615E9B
MPYITVLLNRKGGVGKSLLSVNLAAVYAEILGCDAAEAETAGDGPSVAVVSIDPQGTSIEHAEKVKKAGRPGALTPDPEHGLCGFDQRS